MHVVVAGGGIAGLAAALRLAEAGADVTVVEAADRLGGMLRTSPFAGRVVDEGADAFLVRTPAALDLARRVGLGPELVHPATRQAHVWARGAVRPLPPHLLGVPVDVDALVATGLLSDRGLARLRQDLTAPADPLGPGDRSIAEAVGGRLGPEALATLVDPLLGGISAGDTARLSLAAVAPPLDAARRDPRHASLVAACRARLAPAPDAADAVPAVDREGPATAGTGPQHPGGPDDLGAGPESVGGGGPAPGAAPGADPVFAAPVGGMARLPRAVAEAVRATGRVEVLLGTAGDAIEVTAPGGPVRLVLTDGREVVADGAVLATPGPVAARMVVGVAPRAGELLGAVDHVSVAFVRLAVRPGDLDRPLEGSGLLVPRAAGLAVTACSWASTKWAHLAPEHGDGTLVIRAAVGRDGDQSALDLDDADLAARVADDLARTVGLRSAPVGASVHRWPRAFPQYRPGHLERVAAAEADLATRAPGVALATMALRGVGIPAAITGAHAAADRLLALLRP